MLLNSYYVRGLAPVVVEGAQQLCSLTAQVLLINVAAMYIIR